MLINGRSRNPLYNVFTFAAQLNLSATIRWPSPVISVIALLSASLSIEDGLDNVGICGINIHSLASILKSLISL